MTTPQNWKDIQRPGESEYHARYRTLPAVVQDALDSTDRMDVLKKIGDKYGLHIDMIGVLGEETAFVMLGTTHPRDFAEHLRKKLSVTHEVAQQIAHEVNLSLFQPIRDAMKELHKVVDTDEPIEPVDIPLPIVSLPTPSLIPEKDEERIASPTSARGAHQRHADGGVEIAVTTENHTIHHAPLERVEGVREEKSMAEEKGEVVRIKSAQVSEDEESEEDALHIVSHAEDGHDIAKMREKQETPVDPYRERVDAHDVRMKGIGK
jgi:hypothetical protein